MLKNWQERLCNKNQIPEEYTDILGDAINFLKDLTDLDHWDVINYLTKVPTSNSIAMGRAGVGKTFMISAVSRAKLLADKKEKILILTPSKAPSNVVARKIAEEFQRFPELKVLIVMRAHNVQAEKNYRGAYAKLEALKAKIESDKRKTTKELQAEKKRQILIARKKARDAAKEAEEKWQMLAEVARNMPAPRHLDNSSTDDEEIEMENDNGPHAADSNSILDNILPPIIQEFKDEVWY